MEWRAIEQYDKMKKKPSGFVVFLVAEEKRKSHGLPQTITASRTMGFRTITHFCVLPDVPESTPDL
jgi:hypothetical protein